MSSVEKVKTICKERKIPISKLEKDLNFSNGYIGQLKRGYFPDAKLRKIADYLDVSVESLTSGIEGDIMNTCPDCGLSYNPDYPEDIEAHAIQHSAWEKAVEKFGTLYCVHSINEKVKAKNRNISHDLSQSLDTRYNAQLEVLRCLFSRSIMANGFDLNHVTFDQYVAMMMNNAKYRKHYDKELCDKIIAKYGTMPGIKDGESVYYVSKQRVSRELLEKPKSNRKALEKEWNIKFFEDEILSSFSELNDDNKKKCIAYTENLLSNQKMEEELLNAAHERTDINVTDEMRKHDDDIMDSDDF